ncbi:hypothetical protein KC730_03260, partial [Candidatus Kaiserbacteria bacterium]|nr:hypothetical protein [Candidatus Kaiserbacteria bacterium]
AFAVVQKTLAEHDRQTESMSSPVEAEGVESVVSASPQPNPIEEVKKTESASNLAPEPESDPWVDRSVEMAMVPEAPKPIPKPASPIPSAPIEQPLTPVKSDWEGAVGEVPTNNLEAHSLAESKVKLKTPSDLPLASSLETSSIAGDPLYTDEIDQGLQQLLEEWPIFKKSGLFGTGPKGREHPLFIKISGLQIPLLLAGRFEGATQEIKQSVTDYMNGWRYEQGIIYEHGEAFEHYLRRVIRHIIDLQK